MLSDAQMTMMRNTANKSLPDTCDIVRNFPSEDLAGGQIDDWQTVANDIPCRMASLLGTSPSSEDNVGARITAENIWLLTLSWNQSVEQADQVHYKGKVFEVTYIGSPRTYQVLQRVNVVELA
jgi:hypothetical protein